MLRALRRHHISFKNAFAGLFWAISTQPNFRVHLVLSVLAVALGIYLGISFTHMAIILFTIILGLTAEMMNTAIESMTDLITREWREEAKTAKDVSAGMMLVTAIGAVGVALYIFIPYIVLRFGF
jgi:diacylglycerol kinase (ATP)